ncbi:MAG TPA: UDP-N-acetylmuramoyl-L-alanine--D-glutamate ligase [Rhabdochlamydiaceae bacterium]|nr:UDP-N-acetylmuramoyl-L-alanine--D-glutamate ligase [Rhabdochlamydiaceae bacterium]
MKKVFILGLGISGKAALRYLQEKGDQVTAHDDKNEPLPNIEHVDFNQFDLFVPSPGIAHSHPVYQKALASGIEITSEAELGLKELQEQICIGVTGTNGKTTTVKLIQHLFNQAGLPAKAVGNIGDSLLDYARVKNPKEIVVAELSSYQIETMKSEVLNFGLILNISPNHLDRHASFEEYIQAKCRLEKCLKKEGKLFVHEQVYSQFGHLFHNRPVTYGTSPVADYSTDKRVVKKKGNVVYFLPEDYEKKGMHESENALAAYLIAHALKMSPEQFVKGLRTFSKPAHRIEFVAIVEGISYFNDSKSTNTDATIKALDAMEGPVILIAGGKDKNIAFAPLKSFKGKIRKILAIGSNRDKIHEELKEEFSIEKLVSLEEAVSRAAELAKVGDSVLLSPASSSLDYYRDYAHRGEEYKRFVHHLEERRKNS